MDDIIQQVKARRRELGVTLRDVAELSGGFICSADLSRDGMSLKHVMHVLDILGLCLRVEPKRKPE